MIRDLSEETHRALKARAVQHGRSAEAEMRQILDNAVRPSSRLRIGSVLAALGRKYGGLELRIERDKSPAEPIDFDGSCYTQTLFRIASTAA